MWLLLKARSRVEHPWQRSETNHAAGLLGWLAALLITVGLRY
jgi:hypothetical protein